MKMFMGLYNENFVMWFVCYGYVIVFGNSCFFGRIFFVKVNFFDEVIFGVKYN